ncbi:MAG: PilZ domain-containing protein [Polyangiaceae bacterium]
MLAATSGVSRVERRRSERKPHRLSVKLLAPPGGEAISYLGLTENLSEGGAFIATRAPWDVGTSLEVIIGLSQQQFFHARARVRWRREAWSENGRVPGIGIRFERISPVDTDRIREFARRG